MKTGDAGLPTTTALQARVPLFQPTDRPATLADGEWRVTAWGRVRVTGRLGQRHADALQAMLHTARARRDTDDGGIELLVDPAAVRRVMSDAGYSDQRLKKLIHELRACAVEIQAPRIMGVPWIIGGLLDHAEPSLGAAGTVPNPLGGVRHLLRVRLGKPLAILLQHDLLLTFDPAPIARLTRGISKAIARHVKTHSQPPRGGWLLDALIEVVGGPIAGPALRKARLWVLEDRAGLAAAGVVLSPDGRRVTLGSGVPQGPGGVPQGPDSVP